MRVEKVERRAEQVLASVPAWIWDGESLPIPIEDIADNCAGLLVRDVEDMSAAPGCPELGAGQALSGLLLPSVGEIWVNAEEARLWAARVRRRSRFREPVRDVQLVWRGDGTAAAADLVIPSAACKAACDCRFSVDLPMGSGGERTDHPERVRRRVA